MDDIPLISLSEYSYAKAKMHASLLDKKLGFQIKEVERRIATNSSYRIEGIQYWIGLEPQILQTPYIELRMILEHLKIQPAERVVDLGAAYSRLAYVMGRYYPESLCFCYEILKDRVEEAWRIYKPLGFRNAHIEIADVTKPSFIVPSADYYFIYDFGSKKAIQHIIEEIGRLADQRPICVIGRGRACRDIIEKQYPWLSQVEAPEHFSGFSIYYSRLNVK